MSHTFSLISLACLISSTWAQSSCVIPPISGTVYVQPVVTVCPVYVNALVSVNGALVINEGLTININNAPTSLNLITSANLLTSTTVTITTTTATTTTATVSGVPAAIATPFALAINALPATKGRRQAPSFLDISGEQGSSCDPTTGVFSMSNGQMQLLDDDNAFFAASNASVAFEVFDGVALEAGSIATTFAAVGGTVVWQNAAFDNGVARFCSMAGKIYSVYHGSLPAGCTEVLLSAVPPSICSSTPTSSISSSSTTSSTETPTPIPWEGHSVIAYYNSGPKDQGIYPPELIPWELLTHVCYAFAPTTANYTVTYNATLLSQLSTAAHLYGKKLILSVGGYGVGGYHFSDIVQNSVTINTFVQYLKQIVNLYDLAGIDLDWEFVGNTATVDPAPTNVVTRPTDPANYLNLLKALRAAMPNIYISAAVPMFTFDGMTDLSAYEPYFDAIHLMAYDLWRGSFTAGSNSALPADSGFKTTYPINPDPDVPADEPGPNVETDEQGTGEEGVIAWHNAGLPYNKLVFGVPFYGYGYRLANGNDPATVGLYSEVTGATGKSAGDANEDQAGNSGFWRWRNLLSQGVLVKQADGSYGAGPGWQHAYNETSKTPYVWSESRSEIISYDDPDSLTIKRNYAESLGMAGVMFWAMYGDTDDAQLTKVLQ